MKSSWTSQLIGLTCSAVEREESGTCVIVLGNLYRVRAESLWRLLSSGRLILTSQDDGQAFGLPEPVDAWHELISKIVGRTVTGVDATSGTADLDLNFGSLQFQIISNSSGYEAWQLEGPTGTIAVGQGGGNVVTWG